MGALTETTSNITELGGKIRVAVVEVDGAILTTADSTVTIGEFSVVLGAVAQIKEVTTADCAHVRVETDSTTTNQLNVQLYEDDRTTIATTGPLDFYIIAVGY